MNRQRAAAIALPHLPFHLKSNAPIATNATAAVGESHGICTTREDNTSREWWDCIITHAHAMHSTTTVV